ncbi:hypothetical protein BUALT_Bualt06G0017900 [Buddleja alternifolia]|uniref:Uncharacterized protein n=1 Tax=Buddleja alternifolia TaxID=168488 RepID=A0AAV6XKC2_9LAMI|nr:hypothetical protein BUALT_Bualt06G0017900 [Buddleja alternifolia]
MHLWPSMRLRDSFKNNYLKKLDWNLSRMNIDEQQQKKNQSNSHNQQKLLDSDKNDSENSCRGIGVICREVFMILSCCYCCFCCGVDRWRLRKGLEVKKNSWEMSNPARGSRRLMRVQQLTIAAASRAGDGDCGLGGGRGVDSGGVQWSTTMADGEGRSINGVGQSWLR